MSRVKGPKAELNEIRDEMIARILKVEGGYSNDPNDSGGETNWGITKEVARANGYRGLMQDLTRHEAIKIYRKKYWDVLLLDEVLQIAGPEITEEMLDTGVNMGTGRAAEFMQRTLNALNDRQRLYSDVRVDKRLGARTLEGLKAFKKARKSKGLGVFRVYLDCLQGAFYIRLSEEQKKNERFIYGWGLNRLR